MSLKNVSIKEKWLCYSQVILFLRLQQLIMDESDLCECQRGNSQIIEVFVWMQWCKKRTNILIDRGLVDARKTRVASEV